MNLAKLQVLARPGESDAGLPAFPSLDRKEPQRLQWRDLIIAFGRRLS